MILCGLNVDNDETLIYTNLAEESYNLFIFPVCFFYTVLIVHCLIRIYRNELYTEYQIATLSSFNPSNNP